MNNTAPPLFLFVVITAIVAAVLIALLVSSLAVQRRRDLHGRDRLAGRILDAQDRERARIARDLHDGIVQQLLAVSLALHHAPTRQIGTIAALDGTIEELRQMAHGLHPAVLDQASLDTMLSGLTTALDASGPASVRYTSPRVAPDPPAPQKMALYRVAQEALNNALRHSGADRVSVTFDADDHHVALTVVDRGCGFDPRRVGAETLGVISMRERIEHLGGIFEIDTTRGRGTRVHATLPRHP